jgi:hypothetical protein
VWEASRHWWHPSSAPFHRPARPLPRTVGCPSRRSSVVTAGQSGRPVYTTEHVIQCHRLLYPCQHDRAAGASLTSRPGRSAISANVRFEFERQDAEVSHWRPRSTGEQECDQPLQDCRAAASSFGRYRQRFSISSASRSIRRRRAKWRTGQRFLDSATSDPVECTIRKETVP